GARVGTSSLRRQAQLKAVRADLAITSLRGNVDTRLRKLMAGEFDAIILAAAGLKRLGLAGSAPEEAVMRHELDPEVMCPAAGQGALGIEIRAGDLATRECVAFFDDPAARITTTCERAVLQELGGGCQVPIGAYAETISGEKIRLTAVVARPDGSELLREQQTGNDPRSLGKAVGAALLAK